MRSSQWMAASRLVGKMSWVLPGAPGGGRGGADGAGVLVVLFGVEEHGLGADQPDQVDHGANGVLVRVHGGAEAVGAAAEEVRLRVIDPLRLLAGHGVAADEADVRRQQLAGPLPDALLGAAGVGHHAAL